MRYKKVSLIIVSVIVVGLLFIAGYIYESNSITPASSNLRLINFEMEKGVGGDYWNPEIINKSFESNVLKIQVLAAVTNCVDIEPDIEHYNNVIDLRFKEIGESCDSHSMKYLYYEIEGATTDNYDFKLNGKKIS